MKHKGTDSQSPDCWCSEIHKSGHRWWTFTNKGYLQYWTEKTMAPHSSTLGWKIPWTEEPGRLQSMGSWRVGHDWVTSLSLFTFMHWRRKWQPTPVFLRGESQGRGAWRAAVHGVTMSRPRLSTHEQTSQTLHILNCAFYVHAYSFSYVVNFFFVASWLLIPEMLCTSNN